MNIKNGMALDDTDATHTTQIFDEINDFQVFFFNFPLITESFSEDQKQHGVRRPKHHTKFFDEIKDFRVFHNRK